MIGVLGQGMPDALSEGRQPPSADSALGARLARRNRGVHAFLLSVHAHTLSWTLQPAQSISRACAWSTSIG